MFATGNSIECIYIWLGAHQDARALYARLSKILQQLLADKVFLCLRDTDILALGL